MGFPGFMKYLFGWSHSSYIIVDVRDTSSLVAGKLPSFTSLGLTRLVCPPATSASSSTLDFIVASTCMGLFAGALPNPKGRLQGHSEFDGESCFVFLSWVEKGFVGSR